MESRDNIGDVIEIGEARIRRKMDGHCPHRKLVYSHKEQYIQCEDCKTHIGAFKAFVSLVTDFRLQRDRIKAEWDRLKEATEKHIHRIAARTVEQAWRSKTMVPTCPHCHVAIFPDDGFGGGMINKEAAIQARRFKRK